jgi:hypothetical protein
MVLFTSGLINEAMKIPNQQSQQDSINTRSIVRGYQKAWEWVKEQISSLVVHLSPENSDEFLFSITKSVLSTHLFQPQQIHVSSRIFLLLHLSAQLINI